MTFDKSSIMSAAKNFPILLEFAVNTSKCKSKIVSEKIENAIKEKKLFLFLSQVMEEKDPNVYFIKEWGLSRLPPYLTECACAMTGRYDRFSNQNRAAYTQMLADDLQTNFPPVSKFTLNYLSLGAGGCLQDLFNIMELIKRGYTRFNISLVDFALFKEDEKNDKILTEAFCEFEKYLRKIAEEKGLTIQINAFKKLEGLKQQFLDQRFQIISAIDFDEFISDDEALKDGILVHECLERNGRYYLSFSGQIWVFNEERCIFREEKKSLVFSSIDKDIYQQAETIRKKGNTTFNFALLNSKENLMQLFTLLPEIAKLDFSTIKINLGGNCKLKKVKLRYLLRLFLPESVAIEIKYKDIDKMKSKDNYDIITYFGCHFNDQQKAEEVLIKLRQLNSSLYVALLMDIWKRDFQGNRIALDSYNVLLGHDKDTGMLTFYGDKKLPPGMDSRITQIMNGQIQSTTIRCCVVL